MSRQTLGLLLMALALARIAARPAPQGNPLESLGMSAMSLAGSLAEAVQSGGALTRDLNLDNPLMSLHSKTALGYGDAMRPPSAGDSSEEDRRRRRRRRRRRSIPASLHRHKRAPCWKMGSAATTAAPADDEVEARRRRAQKRAANNASRSRVSPKTSGKTKKLQRRRRQAPSPAIPESGSPMAGSGDPLGLGDRIKAMWLSFVDNVTDVVQQVRQKVSESASSAG
ncbi:uncharacterized protein LOC108049813 [Drosophila rhopaloa]|uniref:Uncharacterized protein LOC108049813 n=1 Tax=Drosophila rhopaloa TaxID=1041015 RepID=A0A6P4FN28_DRORH|nr:uncharacterized protein LOC108049813 [Drosophila rhopaloa]